MFLKNDNAWYIRQFFTESWSVLPAANDEGVPVPAQLPDDWCVGGRDQEDRSEQNSGTASEATEGPPRGEIYWKQIGNS